jgi:hypothetical protein
MRRRVYRIVVACTMGLRMAYYFIMINVNCVGADKGSDQIDQAPSLDKGNTLRLVASLLRVVRRVVFLATGLANVGCIKVMPFELNGIARIIDKSEHLQSSSSRVLPWD